MFQDSLLLPSVRFWDYVFCTKYHIHATSLTMTFGPTSSPHSSDIPYGWSLPGLAFPIPACPSFVRLVRQGKNVPGMPDFSFTKPTLTPLCCL